MRVLVSWSGGKDGALALGRLRALRNVEIDGLLTTFSREFDRVSMHGVRRELLEAQARALGLALRPVFLSAAPDEPCPVVAGKEDGFTAFVPNSAYEEGMRRAMREAREEGIEAIAFGDIYLEDLRRCREALLAREGLRGIFPLWGAPTAALAEEVVAEGLAAICVCTDSLRLGPEWAGRRLDRDFFRSLPPGVEPCGENGEYHSFVFDGPGFARRVPFSCGQLVFRDPFWFLDLEGPEDPVSAD